MRRMKRAGRMLPWESGMAKPSTCPSLGMNPSGHSPPSASSSLSLLPLWLAGTPPPARRSAVAMRLRANTIRLGASRVFSYASRMERHERGEMGMAPEILPPGVRLMGFAAVPSLSLAEEDGGERARSAMAEPKVREGSIGCDVCEGRCGR